MLIQEQWKSNTIKEAELEKFYSSEQPGRANNLKWEYYDGNCCLYQRGRSSNIKQKVNFIKRHFCE